MRFALWSLFGFSLLFLGAPSPAPSREHLACQEANEQRPSVRLFDEEPEATASRVAIGDVVQDIGAYEWQAAHAAPVHPELAEQAPLEHRLGSLVLTTGRHDQCSHALQRRRDRPPAPSVLVRTFRPVLEEASLTHLRFDELLARAVVTRDPILE